jgi:RNAse (barnase) inhibitor barstar
VLVDDIRLDGRLWRTAGDFYAAYLTAVGAPDWHGRNLDALWDSLTGGDVNQHNPPFHIHISGLPEMGGEARRTVERFVALIGEAKAAGHAVEVDVER